MPPVKVIPLWVAFAVMAGTMAVSVGATYLLRPKNALGESGNKFDNPVVDPETYVPVIYGEAIMPMLPVFMDSDPDDENLLLGVAGQCHGLVSGVDKIYFGNTILVVKLIDGDYEYSDKYKGLVKFFQRRGEDTPLVYEHIHKKFKQWTSKHLGAGIASVSIELKYDKDKISSIPSVDIVYMGKKLYDPRDESTDANPIYTSNPVLCVLDYLTAEKYGLNISRSTRIDIPSFIAEANYCDELIDYIKVEPPSKGMSLEIVEKKDEWLTEGAYYKYSYSYCRGSTTSDETQAYTLYESNLSDPSGSTGAITSYGKVKLTGIANSGESDVTLKRIYRQENGVGSYYLVGSIDPDQTTFEDNISDGNVGDVHSATLFPPASPTSAPTVTFTDYSNSALEGNSKYYRYKPSFITATGETAPGPATKRIKTKKTGKSAMRLTEIPKSEDTQVISVRIYRTEGFTDDSGLVYKKLIDLSNGTPSYVDLVGDGSLEEVNPKSSTTTLSSKIKRFTCNGILDTGEDVFNNLDKLLSSCRGKLFKQSGKWKIFIPKIAVPEMFELNEDNIIGDWSFRLSSTQDMPNIVKGTFVNPKTEWKRDMVIWPKTDAANHYLKDDNEMKTSLNLDLPFTTNKKIATTICQVVRKESRNNISAELTAKEEARKLTIGNLVKITHSTPGWEGKLFWVVAVGHLPTAQTRLAIREYTEDDYNYETLEEDTLPGSDTTFPDPQEPPDEIIITGLTEELFLNKSVPNHRIKITFTNPVSRFWDYSDVYVKAGTGSKYELYCKIDRLSNGIFYIQPIEVLNKYYIKACSVSTLGIKQELSDATEYSLTIDAPVPDGVSDLEIENRGSSDNVYGNSFKFRWSDKSNLASDGDSKNSYAHQQVSVVNENIKYLVEIYSSGIPNTVKISGLKANERALRTVLQKQNKFEYTVDNAIDDSRKMFRAYENQKNNPYYKAYYGIPQREIKIVVKTLNGWSVLSSITVSKIVTNKAPDMLKRDGITLIKPDVETILNGAEIKFSHPPDEYDINYFMLLVAGDVTTEGRTPSQIARAFGTTRYNTGTTYVAGANGDVVYPSDLNGHCYKCTTAGKSGDTAPTFPKPSIGTLHPTVNDGTVVWTHWCILRQKKISAQITVDSIEDEVDSASYEIEIKKLDRKKTYYAAVVPYDAYGVGTISDISESFVPGESEDDSKTQIIEPVGADDIVILGEIIDNTNVKFSWTLDSSLDKNYYTFQWRAVKNNAATLQPTEAEANAGVTSGGYKVLKGKVTIDADENTYTVKGLVGYKYFVRIKYVNRAKQSGEWSHTDDGFETWATHSATIVGSADDVPTKWAMYKFTGSVTAYNETQITWIGGTDVLKKKTNSGSNDITINTQATPQSITPNATMFLCYIGTANLALKTEAQLDADATFVAIAKCTTAPSGKCKVLMMISSEHFRISAYEAGFNLLSAITADLGEITAGTVTGATIQTSTGNARVVLNSSGIQAYNSSNVQTLSISNNGSGSIGDKISWTTGGVVTVTGVVADSVAAENIIAGTITGSTLQTASGTGQRIIASASTNEIRFYGNDGGASNKLLSTIGITTVSGDDIIGLFGTLDTTNSKIAIMAQSYSKEAINAHAGGGTANAINAVSAGGHGISAQSSTGYGALLSGNSTSAPLALVPQAATPSNTAEGQLYADTDHKLYYHNGTTFKEIAFI